MLRRLRIPCVNICWQQSFKKSDYMSEKLYPNYDEDLWLRSCEKEIADPIGGQITGTIPKWLKGDLIQNGPGSLIVGNSTFQHIFDSSAFLRKFTIKDGNATCQCKFIESNGYTLNNTAKRIVTNGFGTRAVPDPCHSIFNRIASKFFNKNSVYDNSSVSVYPFDDELYAFGEAPVIHRINQESLNTEEVLELTKHVAIVHHTSHPHVDRDGNVYNIGLSTGKKVEHVVVCFPMKSDDRSGGHYMFENAKIVARIPVRWPLYPTYMHSFGLTENYFVIVEQPWCLSVPQMTINRLLNEPIGNCFYTAKNEMARFSVINRKTGEVKQFYSKAFFYYHIINQYELSDNIVIDICTYKEPLGYQYFFVENMKKIQTNPKAADDLRSQSLRFVLPLSKHEDRNNNVSDIPNNKGKAPYRKSFVEPELLCDISCDMPTINYKNFLGKKYRYYYGISFELDAEYPGMIIKVDTRNKSTKTWFEKNCHASEPIFVPNPNSKEEDDGVILSSLLWGGNDTNRLGLVILDAKTMEEIGRAEFETPSPIPRTFHGWFAPSKASSKL